MILKSGGVQKREIRNFKMEKYKSIKVFNFFLFFIAFNSHVYSSDFSLEEDKENIKKYSFAFVNHFEGNEIYSSDVVVIIVQKKGNKTGLDRKVFKVESQEELKVSLPYNKIRVNVFISPPPIKCPPRKKLTEQECLEKYGRLPSPRIKEKNYDLPQGYFITYEDVKLPNDIALAKL